MKDIDISVVIPAYKSSSFIGATLDELSEHIKSSAYSYEVIIVVDGSPDDTSDTVVKYVEQCKVGVWSVIELSKNFGQHTANLCQRCLKAYCLFTCLKSNRPAFIHHHDMRFPNFYSG